MNDNEFDRLANKLRQERFDKKEILFYKQNAIYSEKLKLKKKRLIIIIQKCYRGYRVRKEIKIKIDKINTDAIISFLKRKRLDRIKKNSEYIFKIFLINYINTLRNTKRMIYFDYLNYCSSQISSNIIGYIFRKKFSQFFMKYKISSFKIFDHIISFKVRKIMNVKKISNIILDIGKYKNILKIVNENYENLIDKYSLIKIEYDTLKLKYSNLNIDDEIIKRNCFMKLNLMKEDFSELLLIKKKKFYELFYKLYLNGRWTKESRFSEGISVLDKYICILNNNEIFIEEFINFEYRPLEIIKQNISPKNTENLEIKDIFEEKEDDMKDQVNSKILNYDDIVIKVNNNNLDLNEFEININEKTEKTEKRKGNGLKRKPLKYDVKKAIENQNLKDKKIESQERHDFKNFLKTNKSIKSPEDKIIFEQEKNEIIFQEQPIIENKSSSNNYQKKRNEKRHKLYLIEKFHKKIPNIKNIKSRIDCWGESQIINKQVNHNNQPNIFNPQILVRIEQEVNNINNKYKMITIYSNKEEKLKSIPICYLKEQSFYINHYNSEIYEQLLIHLNKHYDELKS